MLGLKYKIRTQLKHVKHFQLSKILKKGFTDRIFSKEICVVDNPYTFEVLQYY